MERRDASQVLLPAPAGGWRRGGGLRASVRGALATLVFLGGFVLPGTAWAGLGDLLWADTVNNGNRDQANGAAVRAGRVVAVGHTGDTDVNLDFLVRAYDSETGAFLWQDRLDVGTDDRAHAVSMRASRVFVAGHTGNADAQDFFVRAYDAATGAVAWSDTVNRGDSDRARGIVARDGRVFVTGQSGNLTNLNYLVRAYDAATGALLWEDELVDRGTGDVARSAAVATGRVVVVGNTGDEGVNLDWLVRAYDAATGVLLWENTLHIGNRDVARRVAVARGRVFVAGSVGDRNKPATADNEDWLVRAYDLETGALLWEKRIDDGDRDRARTVIVKQDRVYVGGMVGTFGVDLDLFVQVYNAADGSVIWDDRIAFGTRDQELSLGVYGRRLFVGGHVGDLARREGNLDFFFRGYEAATGLMLFEDRIDVGKRDEVRGIAVHGRGVRVTVVGQFGGPEVDLDFVVRTYSAR